MRDRTSPTARPGRVAAISIDIVLCTPHGRRLAVLLSRAGLRERWALPSAPFAAGAGLDASAERLASRLLRVRPAWLAQFGAFADARRPPADALISVGYVGVTPAAPAEPADGAQWHPVDALPALPPRHRVMIDAAARTLRERIDTAPIAFRLLPPTFTLTELQEIYELLLGRRLHKASFRRSLQSAWLVEPTDEWRSEGRGRPAQLFRYAARRRRGGRRGVRFELLSD